MGFTSRLNLDEMTNYAKSQYLNVKEVSRERGNSTISFKAEMDIEMGEDYAGSMAECVQYQRTTIITKLYDGTILLRNGGYGTPTTQSKMNQHLPHGFQVFQKAHTWYVTKPQGWEVFYPETGSNGDIDANKRTVLFEDGMMIVPPLDLRGVVAS